MALTVGEYVEHYASFYKEYTRESLEKAIKGMLEKNGSVDSTALDYWMRPRQFGGLGYGKSVKPMRPKEAQEKFRPLPEDFPAIDQYLNFQKVVNKAPLPERKAAAQQWFEAMRDKPQEVADAVRNLLMGKGNYGLGATVKARQAAAHKGMNRIAALGGMVAELRWGCPSIMAHKEWTRLTQSEQLRVNQMVAVAIQDWEQSEGIKVTEVRGVSGHLREPGHGRPMPRLTR